MFAHTDRHAPKQRSSRRSRVHLFTIVTLVLIALLALIFLITLLAPPLGAQPSAQPSAQSDFVRFHPVALATIDKPPRAESLHVACSKPVRADETTVGAKGFYTLLAPAGEPAWMVAFALRKMTQPERMIATTPRYGPLPTAKPYANGTLDWAWIWDRNGDGRVDYAAYLQNAHALLPDPLPDSFPIPEPSKGGVFTFTMKLFEAMVDNAAMVYRHYADDDFDGKVDAVVIEEFDPLRPMFVKGWIVASASHHDGVVDRAWAFRRAITDTTRVVAPEADGTYRVPSLLTESGPATEPATARLEHGTRLFAAIDALAAKCGAPEGAIRKP